MKIRLAVAAAALATLVAAPGRAESGWNFELTPYLWAMGVDGDFRIGDRTAEVDASFSDITENLDIGGGALFIANKGRFVLWTQYDGLKASNDELRGPVGGEVENTGQIATGGAGIRLGKPGGRRAIDLLVGARYIRVESEITLNGLGTRARTIDETSPLLIVRPWFRISDRWGFNSTIAFGETDAGNTIEVQPTLLFDLSDRTQLRFGYRSVSYDLESESGLVAFDGSMAGPFLGFGFVF